MYLILELIFYYTMDGDKELAFEELYPVNEFPSDIPYMGSEFYFAHADVRGDEETPYARTRGLWRLDGMTDTDSIEMDGLGGFTMYHASGSVEAAGYLECIDEDENGDFRYDLYTAEGELIVSFYFDSDTQFHLGNDDRSVYLYTDDVLNLIAWGPMEYEEDAACLMNADGSSGGGRVSFDENNNLTDSGIVLTYHGESLSGGSTDDAPKG